MEWTHRYLRTFKNIFGISSPPIVYYISSGQEEIRLNEYSCRKLTHEMHSFVTAASKRINVCNMNLEYHDIFYTNDFITRLKDRIREDSLEVQVIASHLTKETFEEEDIDYRVSYAPLKDFILFDNVSAILFGYNRAYLYYSLDQAPPLLSYFYHRYTAAY